MPSASTSVQNLFFNSPIGRGPIMRGYRKRAFYVWATLAVIGLLPILLDLAPSWRAAGLGLWMPGGGFLYTASPHWFVLSMVLFAASLAAWLLMGGFIFPIIVWGAAAGLAALDTEGTLWPWAQFGTPLLALAVVARALLKEARNNKAVAPRAAEIKTYIESIPFHEPSRSAILGDELSDQDLGAMRFMLDLALQPIDEFKNFVTIDQFREAGWRYQLFHINYALAILQTSRVPAFRGYLHEAQRRSIVKTMDRRVWKYWRIENFVGNLRLDADPIKRDNIMYSGWWGLALGAYERATGDLQFSQPGALTLIENPSKKYVYDYRSMMQVVARNFDADPLCFFPCEPNWVFSICNLFGMTGMLLHDRVHGSRLGLDRLDKFNQIMEKEFTMADGKAAIIMSKRSGFVLATDGASAFASTSQLLNMTSPRLAQVYWELHRYALEEKFGGDRSLWNTSDSLDFGNYQKNRASFWAGLMRGAREAGDTDIYNFAKAQYDELGIENRDGALHWQGSVLTQTGSHIGRFGTPGAWYRLAHGDVPASIHSGPVLDEVPYPHVLVAAADNDGAKLDMVLCSGNSGVRELKFARLQPNGRYRLTNTESGVDDAFVIADSQGNAIAQTGIGARTRLSLMPVS